MGFVTRVARAVIYRLAFRAAVGLGVLLALWALRALVVHEAVRVWPWLDAPVRALGSAAAGAAGAARDLAGTALAGVAGIGPAAAASGGFQVSGAATSVEDGDTIRVLTSSMTHLTVRLASIDAPETAHASGAKAGQPYSEAARRHLGSLVLGKVLTLQCFESDRYERHVCDVSAGSTQVNRAMVSAGLAWANLSAGGRYLRDKSLVQAQAQAREQRLGLWRDREPVAPWVWRQQCWQSGICPASDPR